ncbi:MAG: hypothetical protein HY422_02795 [Candidatus Komeilibacteria bacterium]|nr:hypothetical protein [Candidatus Komeilibacteria bacterium]
MRYPELWLDAAHSKDAQGYGIGYIYGPAIIKENGIYHLFACTNESVDTTRGWDAIRYSKSTDGYNWSVPTVVLKAAPLPNNPTTDRSACDPSVVYFDNHDGTGPQYYLFYSGNGINVGTAMYVARQKTIAGPYLKYTKRGTWEVDPADPKIIIGPAHSLTEAIINNGAWYGAGEQTVLVKGNELVSWYADDTDSFPNQKIWNSYMATSSDGLNWSRVRTDIADHDPVIESVDVKYDPLSDNFVMFSTPYKEAPQAYLERRISRDGIHWPVGAAICPNGSCFPAYGNNVGVSGDNQGHLFPDKTLVGFGSPYLNNPELCGGTAGCILETLSGLTIEGYAGGGTLGLAAKTKPLYQFVLNNSTYRNYYFLTHVFLEGINASFTFAGQAFNVYTDPGNDLVAVYRCFNPVGDHFMSRDANCEGQSVEGLEGYLHASPTAGHAPVYRMYNTQASDHMITLDEARGTGAGYYSESILGYAPTF